MAMAASKWARETAAQAWCGERTSHKQMDSDLAEAFAEILDRETRLSCLKTTTTKRLLEELQERAKADGYADRTGEV